MSTNFAAGLHTFMSKCCSMAERGESMSFFQQAAIQGLSNEGSASQTLNLSLKPEWSTAHLGKMDMEARLLLQCQQGALWPGLPTTRTDLDQKVAEILEEKEVAGSLIKSLLLANLRFAQWAEVVLPLVDTKFNGIQAMYNNLADSLKDQVNSRVRILTTKLDKAEKLLKAIKDSPKGLSISGSPGKPGLEKQDSKMSKQDKDIEKLKVKVIALEKQNAYLVTKEKEIEIKLKDIAIKGKGADKKKTKKTSESVSQDTKKKPKDKDKEPAKVSEVMVFDSPMPSSAKGEGGAKLTGSNIVSKQEKLDKLETSLMDYTQLLSSAVCSLDSIPDCFFDEKVYVATLEMIVETLPKIEKRKILLTDKSEWLRGLLEIGIKLIDNQFRVRYSPDQELVGATDALPLHFTPKTTYWINVTKPKNNDMLMEVNSGFGKLVPNDAVTRKVNELLTGYLNHMRTKISETNEKLSQYRTPVTEQNQPYAFTTQNQGLEIRQSIKKIRSLLTQRVLLTKAMISCYLFIERAANISNEQMIYFSEEIEELAADRSWKDAPLLGLDIRNWYTNLNTRSKPRMAVN